MPLTPAGLGIRDPILAVGMPIGRCHHIWWLGGRRRMVWTKRPSEDGGGSRAVVGVEG